MRTIKFRAYDKDDNKMIYDVYPAPNGDMAGDYNGRFCLRLPAERVILEQFTGLTDKNGKEIYEGDKVKTVDQFMDGDCIMTGFSVNYIANKLRASWSTINYRIKTNNHESTGT